MSTKTLYTCAWGGWWEKYGKSWISQVENLNTKPDQLFVVSDKPLTDCPYEVVLVQNKKTLFEITKYRQTAVDHCTSDWYCPIDIDDFMYPNYLDNIMDDYDIHGHYPANFPEHVISSKRGKVGWETAFTTDKWTRPFSGVSFIKTHWVKRIGIVDYGWQDQSLFMKLRFNNCSAYFDEVPRFVYNADAENSLMKRKEVIRGVKKHQSEKLYKELKDMYQKLQK